MRKTVATIALVALCGLIAAIIIPWPKIVALGLVAVIFVCLILLLLLNSGKEESIIDRGATPPVPSTDTPTSKQIEPGPVPPNPRPTEPEPTKYFEQYLKYIEGKYDKSAADRVRSDVEEILGKGKDANGRIDEILKNPESKHRAKGLVVGRVQSGKTQNYTGLITRAIDEKWNIIIVLTSNNESLKDQTEARLKRDLEESGLSEYHFIGNPLDTKKFPEIKNSDIYIAVVLKQGDHLRGRNGNGKGIMSWLDDNKAKLSDASILIIDDEADNATQNTVKGCDDWSDEAVQKYAEDCKKENPFVSKWIEKLCNIQDGQNLNDEEVEAIIGRVEDINGIADNEREARVKEVFSQLPHPDSETGKESNTIIINYFAHGAESVKRWKEFRQIVRWFFNVKRERSAINQAICNLVNPNTYPFRKMAYVGYTATPYANFLNEAMGADNPLALDFVQSMSLSPEYFGLSKIFGSEPNGEARMQIVKMISQDEHDNAEHLFDGENVPIWDSLKDAIKWAFVAAAIRHEQNKPVTTMLVNLSREIEDHEKLKDCIEKYIETVNKTTFKAECIELFKDFKEDITSVKFKELFPDYPHNEKIQDLKIDDIEKNLDYVFESSYHRVCALNSDGNNKNEYEGYIKASKESTGPSLWIIVGGNRISRGLTFEGLVSTYFDRDSITVNVDTLTQMGRWFGYRVGYELLPRIWMPEGTVKVIQEICRLEEDLHAQINESFERHEDKPNPKMLAISKRLTGRDEAREETDAIENPMTVREFKIQKDDSQGKEIVKKFINTLADAEKGNTEEQNPDKILLPTWRNVSYNKLKTFLEEDIKKYLSPFESKRLNVVLEKIGKDKQFDVVLSSPKNDTEPIRLSPSYSVHVHQISQTEIIENECIRLGKFSGQYMAWHALVPDAIVTEVKNNHSKFGKVGHGSSQRELLEMFEKAGNVNPVLQVGFVEISGKDIPYVSIFYPCLKHNEMFSPARTYADSIFGSHGNPTPAPQPPTETPAKPQKPTHPVTPPKPQTTGNKPQVPTQTKITGAAPKAPSPAHPKETEIWDCVVNILREKDFPLSENSLIDVIKKEYPNEEGIKKQIKKGLEKEYYYKYQGFRMGDPFYYLGEWLSNYKDPIEKIKEVIKGKVRSILNDPNNYDDVVKKTVRKHKLLREIMEDDILKELIHIYPIAQKQATTSLDPSNKTKWKEKKKLWDEIEGELKNGNHITEPDPHHYQCVETSSSASLSLEMVHPVES